MQCKIPEDMREQLDAEAFMHVCIVGHFIAGEHLRCMGRIEWNHGFTYAGGRINERWAIVPMCKLHHGEQAKFRVLIDGIMRLRIVLFGVVAAFKAKYPKSTLI